MTKFVTSLALAIIILASLALPASAQADGNHVDLELDGEGATSWDISNIMPGDSGTRTVTLHNAGDRDGFVIIWISDIVSGEGENPESETGDTSAPGELDQYLLFNIYCSGLDSNISLPTTIDSLPHSATDPDYIKISPLNVGDTITLDWQWQLPVETGNEVQGDSLSFTINYMLEELVSSVEPSGWWPGPPSPSGTTDVRGMVGTGCVFLRSVTAISEHGLCTLTIAEGTVGLTEELECLTEISIVMMDEPPPPPGGAHVIGVVMDFQPSGATFEPPATLEFSYDPSDIPEGIAEEDLVIAYYDEEAGEWMELECTVDPETNTITASISHFTAFAILGYEVIPEAFIPASAAFSLSGLEVAPAEAKIGGTITISTLVENTGEKEGVCRVTLKVNGKAEEVKYLTLDPGASKMVSFTTSTDVAGSYSVEVDGLSGSFTVKEKPAPPPPPPPEEAPPVKPPINWPVIGGIIAGVVIVGLLIFFLVRRRAY